MSGIDNSYKMDGDVLLVIRASIPPSRFELRNYETTPECTNYEAYPKFVGWWRRQRRAKVCPWLGGVRDPKGPTPTLKVALVLM